jgi:hypothetical protein
MKLFTPEERKAERYTRVCQGKRIYNTEEEAHAEGKRLRKRFKMKMRVYHCQEFCGNYHLGHNRTGGRVLIRELVELVDFQRKHGN